MKKSIVLIIDGPRDFNNSKLLHQKLTEFYGPFDYRNCPISKILSTGASGAARLGEIFARRYNIPVDKFLPFWSIYGMEAGEKRGSEIVGAATDCFILSDGQSEDSKHIAKEAVRKGLRLHIAFYEKSPLEHVIEL
jgi:hypothetical protein